MTSSFKSMHSYIYKLIISFCVFLSRLYFHFRISGEFFNRDVPGVWGREGDLGQHLHLRPPEPLGLLLVPPLFQVINGIVAYVSCFCYLAYQDCLGTTFKSPQA